MNGMYNKRGKSIITANEIWLTNPVWDDLQVNLGAVKLPGVSDPTWTAYKGGRVAPHAGAWIETHTSNSELCRETPERKRFIKRVNDEGGIGIRAPGATETVVCEGMTWKTCLRYLLVATIVGVILAGPDKWMP